MSGRWKDCMAINFTLVVSNCYRSLCFFRDASIYILEVTRTEPETCHRLGRHFLGPTPNCCVCS